MGMIRTISHFLAAVFSNPSEFNRHWNDPNPPAGAGTGLPRRWEGQWISEVNGHRGALRCALSQSSPAEYAATFYAVYGGILRVCYTVTLRGERTNAALVLEGDSDLGRLAGGIYHYAGEATERSFRCSYRCKYDHGTFEMLPAPGVK
jgi:hypothetical protein